MYGHDRGRSQQAAKLHRIPHLAAGGRDQAHGGGLGIDHADSCLVGNDGGERRGGGIAGHGDHIQSHRADAGHCLQLVQGQHAAFGGGDHSLVLGDGDKGAGQAAHSGGGHDASLFHRVVEQGQGRRRAVTTAGLHADLLQDPCHGVSHRGSGRQAQIHDAKGHTQAPGRLLRHQLAHAGDAEGRFFHRLRHHVKAGALDALKGVIHHAGPGYAHIDDPLSLSHAMESPGHEWIVLNGVAENHQFGAAEAAPVRGQRRRLFDHAPHLRHGVHVDARLGGAHVHGGAHQIRGRQGLGNGTDELPVRLGKALLHKGGKTPDKIHAALCRRPVHGPGKGHVILRLAGSRHQGDGRDRDALVDNGNAELPLNGLSRFHQILGRAGDLVIDLVCAHLRIAVGAVQQRDPHGNGPDIQMLLVDHFDRL